jgi:putative DNA primase/helicase
VILVTGGHRHQAADGGLDALKRARVPLYVRDLEIVGVVPKLKTISKGTRISMPVIHRVGLPGLGRFAGQGARWHRHDQHGRLQRIDPPRPVIEQMMEMQSKWPFPPITGICGAPGLRPDFSLLNTEGYDAQTGLYCDFGGLKMPHIPTRPTRAQAEAALKLILDIVDTFPWVDQPSRAAMVSGMITPVVRGAVDVVPMIVVSGRAPGTGKTYFVHLCAVIATGQKVPPIAMGSNQEEFEKRLVMAGLEGRLIILIDNVRRVVQSDLLCQLTEQRLCNLRALGTSVAHEIVNNFCISITGNNAQIAADLTRRGLRSLLDANMENPEQKQHKDPQLLEHVLQRRPELIAACLTVPLYYHAADKPNALPRLASYGEWSDNVRSALVHLGHADSVETMSELRRTDPVRVRRAQVFEAWLRAMKSDLAIQAGKQGGLTTGELVSLAETDPDLREALLEVADPKGTGRIDNRELGKWLSREEGTIVLDHKLCCDRETNTQKPRWRLVAITEVEEQGSR